MICDKCKHESHNMFCGQGFRDWICKLCGKKSIHHNTAVPKVCKSCSEKHNVCENCGEKIK